MDKTIELILRCAEIPSFSSYEERLHPLIESTLSDLEGVEILPVPQNNLLITTTGRSNVLPVAVTAHLDKINHLGKKSGIPLPARRYNGKCVGQLDDAMGVGICLELARLSVCHDFPPLYILLSEMEESYGFRHHPSLLRPSARKLRAKIGAERLTAFMLERAMIPGAFITVDTTPLFKGNRGVAVYCRHWQYNNLEPSPALIGITEAMRRRLVAIHPSLEEHNNSNDYVRYGELFNGAAGISRPIPSIALEPAIHPYHQLGEEMHVSDIQRVLEVLVTFLETWNPTLPA